MVDGVGEAAATAGICAARLAFRHVAVAVCADALVSPVAAATGGGLRADFLLASGLGSLLVDGGAVAVDCSDDATAAKHKRKVGAHRDLRLQLGLLTHAQARLGRPASLAQRNGDDQWYNDPLAGVSGRSGDGSGRFRGRRSGKWPLFEFVYYGPVNQVSLCTAA